MTDDAEKPTPRQDAKTGRFVPGNNGGPGRPKGARNKLGEAFLADMLEDWEENGQAAIATVRAEKPDVYVKVVASILPRDLNVNMNPLEEATDEELIQRLRDLDEFLKPFLSVEGGDGVEGGARTQKAH
mgnify:CR=1 FL=1